MALDFDSILADVGDFGLYQYIMYFLICIPASVPSAWNAFNQVFVAAVPEHWCKPSADGASSGNFSRLMERLRRSSSISNNQSFSEFDETYYRYSQCYQFDFNNISTSDIDSIGEDELYTKWIPCQNGWEYDRTTYDSTIVTDFNLVCDLQFWPAFCTMMFYLGSFAGNILFGYIADRYGRRASFFFILGLQVIVGTANAFAQDIYSFTVLRSIVGLCFPALYQVPFIIGMELMGPSSRIFAGMAICVVFGTAMCLLGIVASLIRSWSTLTIVCNAPFLLLFSYWWFLPESPRWLVSVGKHDQATEILLKIAKFNKREVDAATIRAKCVQIRNNSLRQSPRANGHNILDLFRTPNMRKMTLLITYIWFVNAIVYNGLTFNVSNLEVNDYVSFIINGAVEIPAYFITWPLLNRVGRRWPLCVSMLIGGAACICTMFVPADKKWAISGLAFVGKFGIAASFAIIYIFAGELYPTVLRAVGMGMSSMVAGIGLLVAPYLVYLGLYFRILPLLIMGGLTVSAGILAMFLPETLGLPLPQTTLDSERFGKHAKFWSCKTVLPRRQSRAPHLNELTSNNNHRLLRAAAAKGSTTAAATGGGLEEHELLNVSNGDANNA